jgi:DNA-binding response OmpR family regulator
MARMDSKPCATSAHGKPAYALAGDRTKCLNAGMDEYMSKPIHLDLFAKKLNQLEAAAQSIITTKIAAHKWTANLCLNRED